MKKSKIFRILSLLVIFTMVVGVFAACNKPPVEETTEPTEKEPEVVECICEEHEDHADCDEECVCYVEPPIVPEDCECEDHEDHADCVDECVCNEVEPTDPIVVPATPPTDKAEILALYTEVMNKAKADKPAYEKKQFQAVAPAGKDEDRKIIKGGVITSAALKILEGFFILEKDATWSAKEKGSDAAKNELPIINNDKGCLLTDASFIKEAKCEVLSNGNWKITIVLNSEVSPEPTPDNGAPLSKVGSLIYPISGKDVQSGIDSVAGLTANEFKLTYRDATAIAEFDSATQQLVSLELIADIGADIDVTLTGINLVGFQRIWDKVFFKDFVY